MLQIFICKLALLLSAITVGCTPFPWVLMPCHMWCSNTQNGWPQKIIRLPFFTHQNTLFPSFTPHVHFPLTSVIRSRDQQYRFSYVSNTNTNTWLWLEANTTKPIPILSFGSRSIPIPIPMLAQTPIPQYQYQYLLLILLHRTN